MQDVGTRVQDMDMRGARGERHEYEVCEGCKIWVQYMATKGFKT